MGMPLRASSDILENQGRKNSDPQNRLCDTQKGTAGSQTDIVKEERLSQSLENYGEIETSGFICLLSSAQGQAEGAAV